MSTPVTTGTVAEELQAAGWARVGTVDDVPYLEGRRTQIGGTLVAIFKLDDGFAAIDAVCPHKGGPLQDGLVADNCVTCPLHDRRVDLRTGEVQGEDTGVAVHEVRVEGVALWVRLAAA